jgi:hypothetical protein
MLASMQSPEMLEGFQAFKAKRAPEWVHPSLRRNGRL